MKTCPICKKANDVRHSRSSGFFERGVRRVFFLRAFRCSKCESRFYRFSWHNEFRHREESNLDEPITAPSLQSSQDRKDFEELVRVIREAEHQSERSSPEDQ